VSVPAQDVGKVLVLNVDRHVGEIRRRSPKRIQDALLLERLRRRPIDLEHPHIGEQFLTTIGVRVEPGAQNHKVRSAVGHRTLECLVDEPRADHHHPHRVDHLEVLHRLVVAEA
jgi:hypothetical protein